MAQKNPGPTQYKPTAQPGNQNVSADTARQVADLKAAQAAAAQAANPAQPAQSSTAQAEFQKAAAAQQTAQQQMAAQLNQAWVNGPGTSGDKVGPTAQPSAQQKKTATTTQEATGGIYQVQPNGQAPKGLKAGDQVVTGGGTYTITGVNADGTYTSKLTNAQQTTGNYTGQYSQLGAPASATPGAANTPQQPAHAQGFDPNVDYEGEIQKAVAAGNLQAAAVLEQMRNAKIQAMGLQDQYALTNTYAQYLGQASPEYTAQLQSGYVRDTTALGKNPYDELYPMVDQWAQNENLRQANQIDYATEKGITELERAKEDAQPEFENQRKQLDIDTARAMANSAFYAEARGDRGGIGQSQYNEIQAAALQNKQAIQTAQTKLATDTARQIADLRAQGEYQKADALLQVAQKALTQLMSLKQSGAEYTLQVEQMKQSIDQALRNFAIQEAQLTGVYNEQPTLSAQKYDQENALSLLGMVLQYGGMPSEALLKAAGYDPYKTDIQTILQNAALASNSSGGSGGGRGSGSGSGSGNGSGLGDLYTLTPEEESPGDDGTTRAIKEGSSSSQYEGAKADSKKDLGKVTLGSDDEGVLIWNGKAYGDPIALLTDANKAGLTAEQENRIRAVIKKYYPGLNI